MADTTTELEVLDEIVDVLGGESGQYETVVPTLQQIRDLLGGGGGGSGYNPSLSVGRADALTGADETAQWAQRESTGSGSAIVRSVQGAAVVWNQLVGNIGISRTDGDFTITVDGGSMTINGTNTTSEGKYISLTTQATLTGKIKSGNKYLVATHNETVRYYLNLGGFWSAAAGSRIVQAEENSVNTTALIAFVNNGDTLNNVVLTPQLFDLTQMFGSGNEPSTVAEFEQMYPEAYYPYSAPVLKPVQISGIASTDAQGGELDSVEWTTQTLRAAGTIRDELTSDELITRVGVVDLGDFTWTYADERFGTNDAIPDATGAAGRSEISCAPYVYAASGAADKTAFIAGQRVYVYDSAYTDAADFKAAMNGVILFYILATPTTQPISPALPMTYRVQQGGTEAIIVPEGEISAPPILTVAEGESAAELVMDALACIATPDGPVATANHSVGTYLTMGGKLYKVTSAIAVGETITPNTNVTQTTVMAELIARTA